MQTAIGKRLHEIAARSEIGLTEDEAHRLAYAVAPLAAQHFARFSTPDLAYFRQGDVVGVLEREAQGYVLYAADREVGLIVVSGEIKAGDTLVGPRSHSVIEAPAEPTV